MVLERWSGDTGLPVITKDSKRRLIGGIGGVTWPLTCRSNEPSTAEVMKSNLHRIIRPFSSLPSGDSGLVNCPTRLPCFAGFTGGRIAPQAPPINYRLIILWKLLFGGVGFASLNSQSAEAATVLCTYELSTWRGSLMVVCRVIRGSSATLVLE